MKRLAIVVVALSAVLSSLWAVPAAPYSFRVTQPDGTELTVRLVGDENFHYYTLEDGTPILQNEDGYWVEDVAWAAKSEKAQVRRVAKREMIGGGFPLKGSPKALVLLIGFKDLPFAQSRADFDALLNESGYSYNGATGSCRDYFIASSDSMFQPQFDVYGPYTASKDMKYYGGANGDNHDSNPHELIIEACQLAADAGVDFSQYDTNNDGVLDNVFVYFAGHNQAEGGSPDAIWPHQSNLGSLNISVDGKRLGTYACTSEYRGNGGATRASIGTFCHEFGHVLGLPDFYDTSYQLYTVGNWDIMCSGNYNNDGRTPPTYTSYERFFLGWLKPIQLTEKGQYFLEPLETSNTAYLLAASTHNLLGTSPSPSEFFLIENRQHVGWDEPYNALPGTGMLVWHIDYSASAWNSNSPNNGPKLLRMHLEEANGIPWNKRSQGESGRSSDPYPGTGGVTRFTPTLHDGTVLSEQHIFNIAETGNLLSFTYIAAGDAELAADVKELALVTTVSDANKIVNWKPKAFHLTGKGLDPTDNLQLKITGNFSIALADKAPARGNAEWKKTARLAVNADSTVSQTVWVCFNPAKQNCNAVNTVVSVSGAGVSLSMPISGVAARPTYVSVPKLKPTSLVTPYSFLISWEPVKDATEYYVTLFSVAKGTSSFLQSFEKFDSPSAVVDEGWESNTNTVTTASRGDGNKSLYLRNTGDCVTSEEYPFPITSLSFWLNSVISDVDTTGFITWEAWNGKKWVEMPKMRTNVLRFTHQETISHTFDVADNYTRFRFTYIDNGGAGVAFDAFNATCSEKVDYIYRGRALTISDVDGDEEYTISNITGLTPSTTYYYRLRCSDLGRGCEEHLTDMTDPVQITTMPGLGIDDKRHLSMAIDSINFDKPTHAVYLQNASNSGKLYIYNASGRLVYSCSTALGQTIYTIPEEKLIPRNVYIIKYVEENKMKRKQRWAKFVL